jgi:hypothetical protein
MIRVSSSRCKRSGEGQYIDLASQETIAALSGDGLLDYIMNQRVPKRRGNRDDLMAPHNCYRCRGADHWVSIAVATGELLGLSPDEIQRLQEEKVIFRRPHDCGPSTVDARYFCRGSGTATHQTC